MHLWFSEGEKREMKGLEGRDWGVSGLVICITNGIILAVGSAQCKGSCALLESAWAWHTHAKKKKKSHGDAISKVRLVQQSFGFELVLVTHYDVVFCLFGHRSHLLCSSRTQGLLNTAVLLGRNLMVKCADRFRKINSISDVFNCLVFVC